jgi:hypothetical protein
MPKCLKISKYLKSEERPAVLSNYGINKATQPSLGKGWVVSLRNKDQEALSDFYFFVTI